MNETTPKISVIVPVYKAEAYLHRCVDSLLAQTFTDFEVLLVDDGSPDRSGEICDEYARKDRRVRVFHKENGGVSSARNMGLDNARGEYVCFVDSDDWVEGNYLKIMYGDISNYNVDLVVHGFRRFTPEGKEIGCESYSDLLYDLDIDLHQMLSEQSLYYRGSPYEKKKKKNIIVKRNIKFDISIHFGEDLCFLFDYLSAIHRVLFSSKSHYNYIQYNNSSVHKRFTFLQEYTGYTHLKDSFYNLFRDEKTGQSEKTIIEHCRPYLGWVAFFLFRSILVISNKHDYALIKDYDWLFLKQYFKPQTRKGQVEYLIISQISSCYYFLICYLKIRHKMFR